MIVIIDAFNGVSQVVPLGFEDVCLTETVVNAICMVLIRSCVCLVVFVSRQVVLRLFFETGVVSGVLAAAVPEAAANGRSTGHSTSFSRSECWKAVRTAQRLALCRLLHELEHHVESKVSQPKQLLFHVVEVECSIATAVEWAQPARPPQPTT